MDIRDCIRQYLEDNGYKQVAIAARSGISEKKLSAVLNKKRRLEASEFFSICDAISVKPDDIRRYGRDAV